MHPDSESSADESKKFSKKNSKLDPTSIQQIYFLFQLQSIRKQLFKLREDLLAKAFITVCIMQLHLGQAVVRVEWLKVVLQMVKGENESSKFSLY